MNPEAHNKILIWLTGTLTQYKVTPLDFETLKFNQKTFESITETRDPIFIICVKDEGEKEQYLEWLKNKSLQDVRVLFLPYHWEESLTFDNLLTELQEKYPEIDSYLDYSKSRLLAAANHGIKSENVIHISQLLN